MRRIFILCISLAMSAFAFNSCEYPDWAPESSTGGDEGDKTPGKCIYTGNPSSQRVIFAIAY